MKTKRRYAAWVRIRKKLSVESILFAAGVAGLAWVPFWFGSDREFSWNVNAVYFGALTAVAEFWFLLGRRSHPISPWRIWPAITAFSLLAFWMVAQIVPWTPHMVHNAIWQYARDTFGSGEPGRITINPRASEFALQRWLTAGTVFWLFMQLSREPRRAFRVVQAIAWIGVAYSGYGVIAFFELPGTLLWFQKSAYLNVVTSTFVNRNSYACYAGLGLICALAVAMKIYGQAADRESTSARRIWAFLSQTAGVAGATSAGALLISLALVLTASRGGISATLGGVLILCFLVLLRGVSFRTAGFVMIGLLLPLAVLFAFGDVLANRLTFLGLEATSRLAIYRLTLLSILDAPLTGFGYGTFAFIFPLYRDSSVASSAFVDMAHNTYLEEFQGLGIPGGLILLSLLGGLVWQLFRAAIRRRQSATAPIAAAAASTIVLLHSFVDFSMQMQAVALTWTALVAAGMAQSWPSLDTTSRALQRNTDLSPTGR